MVSKLVEIDDFMYPSYYPIQTAIAINRFNQLASRQWAVGE
jgi:hypothetical protein